MVSAADPRAAAAGVEILRKGGSATDAAIATMLALNVVEPQSAGIGARGTARFRRDGGEEQEDDEGGEAGEPVQHGRDTSRMLPRRKG